MKKTAAALDPSSFSTVPIYDVEGERDIKGNVLDFSKFQGKVLYIVNVASYCGYTAENYELFRNLKKYRSQGLEIIIAPCNQFGSQEPGSAKAIYDFAETQEFEGLILEKGDVNGENTRPLFKYLKVCCVILCRGLFVSIFKTLLSCTESIFRSTPARSISTGTSMAPSWFQEMVSSDE